MIQSQQLIYNTKPQKLQQPNFQKTLLQYKQFFSSNDNYRTHYQHYKQLICNNDTLHICCIVYAMKYILHDQQADPYAKLLCLRFIKDIFCGQANYGFVTLVNSIIIKQLWQLIMKARQQQQHISRKHQLQDNYGQTLFIHTNNSQYSNEYVRRIGVSCYKIILQMIQVLSTILPYCIYDDKQYKMQTSFNFYYKILNSLQVMLIPENKRTYYKKSNIQNIVQIFRKQKYDKQQINKFYLQLFKLLNYKNLYQVIKDVISEIVCSGDQYCVHICVKYVKQIIQEHFSEGKYFVYKVDYLDLLDAIIMTGDIQSALVVQRQLFLDLIQIYAGQYGNYKQIQKYIIKWAWLLQNFQLGDQYCSYYKEIRKVWINYHKYNFKNDILLYQNLCKKMKQKNIIKLKNIKPKVYDLQQLKNILDQQNNHQETNSKINNKQIIISQQIKQQQLLSQYSKKTANILSFQQILITPQIQIIDQHYIQNPTFKPSSRFITFNSSINRKNSQFKTHTSKQDKSIRSFQSDIRNKFYASNYKKNVFYNNNNENSEIDSKKYMSAKNSSDYGMPQQSKISEGNFNKDYDILKTQIFESQKKQMLLQQQLKKKDEIIKKLTSPPQNIKLTKKPQQQKIISQFSQTVPLKKNQQNQYFPSITSLNSQAKQIYKMKKDKLKKKVLILKNSLIQVGLITKNKVFQNLMECQLFLTPFISLTNVQIQIKCKGNWLRIKGNDKQTKQKITAEMQYSIKFYLSCKLSFSKIIADPPQINFSFNHRSSACRQTYSIVLPINLNKFIESIQFQASQYHNLIEIRKNTKSSSKTLQTTNIQKQKLGKFQQQITKNIIFDTRICKNYQDFVKYFANGIKLQNEGKKYLSLMKGISLQFFLEINLNKSGNSTLRFIPKSVDMINQQLFKQVIQPMKICLIQQDFWIDSKTRQFFEI